MRTHMILAGLSLGLIALSQPSNAADTVVVQDQNDAGPTIIVKTPVDPPSFTTALQGDANHDGRVDATDILTLLENWGVCKGTASDQSFDGSATGSCDGDLNGDHFVNQLDLLLVLNSWK